MRYKVPTITLFVSVLSVMSCGAQSPPPPPHPLAQQHLRRLRRHPAEADEGLCFLGRLNKGRGRPSLVLYKALVTALEGSTVLSSTGEPLFTFLSNTAGR